MKTIFVPEVYLVGRQEVDQDELDRFLCDHRVAWETDSEVGAEVLSETAGRVCYMSFAKPRPGGNAAYLRHIKEVGHGSVLEHAVFNLLITGVSRALSHELVRHRAGFGYSQLSQRYVDESVAEYVVPPALQAEVALAEGMHAWCEGYRETSGESADEARAAYLREHPDTDMEAFGAGNMWLLAVSQAHLAYTSLAEYLARKLARGVKIDEVSDPAARQQMKTDLRKGARQAARSVLPNACETKLMVTGNARALRHFIEQRGSAAADPEIRALAALIHARLVDAAPNLFGDYVRRILPDDSVVLETPYPKV